MLSNFQIDGIEKNSETNFLKGFMAEISAYQIKFSHVNKLYINVKTKTETRNTNFYSSKTAYIW